HHPRAAVSGHDAVGPRQHEQSADRPEGGQQPALPAARPVAQAGPGRGRAGGHKRSASCRRAGTGSRGHARPQPGTRAHAQPLGQPMKSAVPIVALLVAVLLVASQSIYTVDQRQYAIKFQLGQFIDANTDAGLYFKIPLVQNIKFYDRRILLLDAPRPDRITTSEKKPLNVDFIAYWRIADVRKYYQSV